MVLECGAFQSRSTTVRGGVAQKFNRILCVTRLERKCLDMAERCQSGRMGVPGKDVCWKRHQGFESLPLRHVRNVANPPSSAMIRERQSCVCPSELSLSQGCGMRKTERMPSQRARPRVGVAEISERRRGNYL